MYLCFCAFALFILLQETMFQTSQNGPIIFANMAPQKQFHAGIILLHVVASNVDLRN